MGVINTFKVPVASYLVYNLWWMEPKFQSSFIPRGPAASNLSSGGAPIVRRTQRDIFSLLATTIFTISLLFGIGVFGYKFFLNYRIKAMGAELEAARAALDPDTVNELIRLNARLVSTKELLESHRIISPVFDFLEASTPANVRYTDFNFNMTSRGLELTLRGEARGYSTLAAASDLFNRSPYFSNPVFGDLSLDERGSVIFALTTDVEPSLLSYERFVNSASNSTQSSPVIPVSTSTPSSTSATSSAGQLPTGGQLPPGGR